MLSSDAPSSGERTRILFVPGGLLDPEPGESYLDRASLNVRSVPTFAELGFPDLVATTWFALSGPPRLPPDIVDRLNREVLKALDLPEVRARLEHEGIEAEGMDAAAFAAFVQSEIARWAPIMKSSGVKAE